MKIRVVLCVALVAGLLGWGANSAFTKDEAPGGADDGAAMMEMMEKLGKPGAQHEVLATLAGEWDVNGQMFHGPEPTPMKGTSTAKLILGGRWLQHDYTGHLFGRAFHGRGYLGHDNFKKEYVSTWIDDFGSGMDTKTGTASEDGKTITTTGVWEGPMGTFDSKMIWEVKDANTYTITSYATHPDHGEFKEMELTYTRKSAQPDGVK